MTSKDKLNILVFNPGSSSVKYRLIKMPEEKDLITGEAERVGIKTQGESFISHTLRGKKKTLKAYMPDHASAFREIMKTLEADTKNDPDLKVGAFAHRYVHPGKLYNKTIKLDRQELKDLKSTFDLAPLHNPVSHSFMEFCGNYPGEVPQYAVFDTAFHAKMPPENYTYAIPEKLALKHGIRRVGFHGISHEFVTAEACKFLKREYRLQKIISCHLGTGGASIAAIRDGSSISNTMGFTPLEGLVMNTRSGDLDISALLHLMDFNNYSIKQADEALNKKSGVLGAYGLSSDLRDVIKKLGT
ncbi:MAG: acetate kinase, partial [Candidatus Firestonebacteria bacterium]